MSNPKILHGQGVGKDKATVLNKAKAVLVCLDSASYGATVSLSKPLE